MKMLYKISFFLLCILQIALLYCEPMQITSIASILLKVQYFFSFCTLLIAFSSRTHKIYHKLVIILIIWSLFSAIINGFNYNSFVYLFLFISMIGIWIQTDYWDISKFKRPVLITFVLLSCLIVYLAHSGRAYTQIINIGENAGIETSSETLTLGFNNSNETGAYLYYTISILLSLSLMHFTKKIKLVLLIFSVYFTYLLYLTGCRSSLGALLIVVTMFCVDFINNKLSTKKSVIRLFLFLPLLFSIGYVYLSQDKSLLNLEIMGKPLFSGREELFMNYFDIIKSNFILGNASLYQFSNMLNIYITLLVNIGILGLLLYIRIMYIVICSLSKTLVSKSQKFAYFSILGILINACTESSLLISGGKWFFFILVLYMIAYKPDIIYNPHTNNMIK